MISFKTVYLDVCLHITHARAPLPPAPRLSRSRARDRNLCIPIYFRLFSKSTFPNSLRDLSRIRCPFRLRATLDTVLYFPAKGGSQCPNAERRTNNGERTTTNAS